MAVVNIQAYPTEISIGGTELDSRSEREVARQERMKREGETGFSACRRRRPPVRGEMPFPASCGSAWPQP